MRQLLLRDLLASLGYAPASNPRIVRHSDRALDFEQLLATGEFEDYQRVQPRGRFGEADELVSFVALPNGEALFAGVYRVEGAVDPGPDEWPPRFAPREDGVDCVLYSLVRDERFDVLRGRLVIQWGAGTRTWVQRYGDGSRQVTELRPAGTGVAFPGHHAIHLSFAALTEMVADGTRYRDWHRELAAVSAVYLIVDHEDGRQYVGSASGAHGLLGRWRDYVQTGHGGNKLLRDRIAGPGEAIGRLWFSVLDVMPITSTPEEVRERERLQKTKLGSNVFGLNAN